MKIVNILVFLFISLSTLQARFVPILVGDIPIFIPYSDVKVSLGNDRTVTHGENAIFTANINLPNQVLSYSWSRGTIVLGTENAFSTSSLSVGTHTITLTIIDNDGVKVSDTFVVVIEASIDDRSTAIGELVGTTKGEFSVNQGTANYQLKIAVPSGVAGMKPKLSLNYSSSDGNGYMGMGWSIGGVNAITRCSQTKAIDGDSHKFGVNYNSDDRFCLDGQRLIVVNGLAYGADGAEYRTEIDTYVKVTSHGVQGSGPVWFEVKTKSGLIYEYGREHHSSQAISSGNTLRFWKVGKIKDSYENAIHFYYLQNTSIGEHYLNRITYANNTIQYNYETRDDVSKGYKAGYVSSIEKRLKEVVVSTGNSEISRYIMRYTQEALAQKRSRISSIVEQVNGKKLSRLHFTWEDDGSHSLKYKDMNLPSTYLAKSNGLDNGTRFVDLNNDGHVDIIQLYMSHSNFTGIQKVYLGDGQNFTYNSTYSSGLSDIFFVEYRGLDMGTRLKDINGDGLVDLVQSYLRNGATQKRIYLNDGTKFTYNSTYSESLNSTHAYICNGSGEDMGTRFTDINGDGLIDMIQLYTPHPALFAGVKQRYVYLNNGSSRPKIYEPYTYSNVQVFYDADSKKEIKKIYQYNYLSNNGLGNIAKIVHRTGDLVNKKYFVKTVINEYNQEDIDKWYIGRLGHSIVIHSQTSASDIVRKSSFNYNDKGLLSQEIVNVDTSVALSKSYLYDKFGNKISETIAGAGIVTASTQYGYSSDGKFKTSITNSEGLSESYVYDARFGRAIRHTGPNGLSTSWKYDDLGRKVEERRADGTWRKWSHLWQDARLGSKNVYKVVMSASGLA